MSFTIDRVKVINDAISNWNDKTEVDKLSSGKKYQHAIRNNNNPIDWLKPFDCLNERQRSIIIKGELIRLYDSLSNQSKTCIKRELGLSEFQSKWFKLNSEDKKILLNFVLNAQEL